METLFIYLLKSSGLIAVFYLSYHFLVRKETFFNSNRWFLITGLFTSLLLPLFSIKKIIYIERPKISVEDLVAYSKLSSTTVKEIPAVEVLDWMQFIWVGYILIASLLIIKIVLNILSLYRMLYKQQVAKKENFTLVDINENIAPFSFFKYIVYNSNLYTNEELQSILLHEKIHSQERHSLDVLIAKLFCIVFWFNPFVWLYKKAITQNLEYIADQKAIEQLEDKKAYQKALLKVVSNQSCLSITNNFYQSLIKKRIVMLNTNQSHKKKSWKYALVIPALIGFVLLFQVKTIAQEKTNSNHSVIDLTWTKNTTDEEFKKDALIASKNVIFDFTEIIRNEKSEIMSITISFKDNLGNNFTETFANNKGILPIHFIRDIDEMGKGKIGYFGKNDSTSNNKNVDAASVSIVVTTDKNATDEEMKTDSEELKKQGIEYTFSNVKRNSKGEITSIKIKFDDYNGHKGVSNINGDEPIKPIYFNADKENGQIGFVSETTIEVTWDDAQRISTTSINEKFPVPPTPPKPPTLPTIVMNAAPPLNFPKAPAAPKGTPITNEKEWKKFEKKMEEFEKKMEAMNPEIEAYAAKMSNIDEQMKPFEKEMEEFEKKMEIFETQMKEYEEKLEIYQEKMKSE